MDETYDLFVSYAWADRARVGPLVAALRDCELRVFVDDSAIDDFERITTTITQGLAQSKALLAYYSAVYPTRRACQWELTAAYLAALRDGDPAKRIFVVNPESTADHLYPGELRDARFGHAPAANDSAALAELARIVAARMAPLLGPLSEVAPLVPARWLPTQGLGATRFVDRLPDMWRIHSMLHPAVTQLTEVCTGPAVMQVRGIGGVGKSLLVEEYALRFGAAYPGGVFWLRAYGSHEDGQASTVQELVAEHDRQVRVIAARLGLPVAGRSPDEVIGALAGKLGRQGKPCLWVVDDLPDGLNAPQVQELLAPHPVACTLFTTRSHHYEGLAKVLDLDVLPAEDAFALLAKHQIPQTYQDRTAAEQLVADLGYHALAVDVAGAALRAQAGPGSFAKFRAALQKPSQDELELAGKLTGALPVGHQPSIAATLKRSITRLSSEGTDVLRLATVVATAPLPLTLIAAVFQKADNLEDPAARHKATSGVAHAKNLSLASPTGLSGGADTAGEPGAEGGWLVHTLVARTMQYSDQEPARTAALRQAAVAVLSEELKVIVDPSAHTSLREIIPHARELARAANTGAEVQLLGLVARYEYERGQFRSAEVLYRQQLDFHRRLASLYHGKTIIDLAAIKNQGRG